MKFYILVVFLVLSHHILHSHPQTQKLMFKTCYVLLIILPNASIFVQKICIVLQKCVYPCLVIQPCPALCDLMDYSPPGSSVCGILHARILEWVHSLLQGIFLTQGQNPNPCLLHCRQILYHLSHQGSHIAKLQKMGYFKQFLYHVLFLQQYLIESSLNQLFQL